jgi:hypothetical protein
MLKDKIERLESRGKKIKFYWIPGNCRGPTRRKSNQSKKAETVNYYYQLQILKPIGIREAKRSFTVSAKTPNGTEDKTTLKGTTRMARLRGSAR